ncbi:MAG: rod shape-determining protein RodA [Candidatus Magasanikbacteria bacterium RIFCSPHIGHO2_01_FULL_50_8]|uniref:Rod shape-determining protein RodA n=1 Tax=Candidatus Magasanikbacteria bacterium RIFCSPHIGHO2_01_FULL_50_8 TaxID=1798674 RepID=A0A1F6LU87_9BACT|nr:MAG: rod shape-determining protein RodA [Candidatus Magasanikbacteria bacterium RIFCSPHIGHO2_01_FULL_50_8]
MDWLLFGAVSGVVVLGLLAIASVDLSYGTSFDLLRRQLLATAIGIVAVFIIARVHPEFFRATSRSWYFFGIALLIAVLVFGETIRGTKGWFQFAGFSFQPVELMKLALLVTLARIIDRRGRAFHTGLFFFGTALIAAIPIFLVMAQPDLGSALVLGALWLWLVFFVGTRRAFLTLLVTTIALGAVIGWFAFLKPYQKERLLAFVQPERDPLGTGYNVQQSIIAIGSGGFFGRGFAYGSQNQLSFLPERQTDFIFSVIGEELGFIGVTALFVCYALIGWRLVRRATAARDDFTLIMLMGCLGLWLIQIVVNLGGTMGLVPVTGITLPFVSYGGSSLIMNLVLLGMVESIAIHQRAA